jgi:dihydrodipicolinate synthase/N-acetylneuraminate lyase
VSVSSAAQVLLPRADGSLEPFVPGDPAEFQRPREPLRARVFLAAAHVVADPFAGGESVGAAIDWDATVAYRRHLWSWGLGVAEAMDTAQRGMGVGWQEARELIARSAEAARDSGGRLAAGAGTDQLPPGQAASLGEIRDAYLEQCEFVEGQGCQQIVMASRALAAAATGPKDYRTVYDAVLERAGRPVILHWLGRMFDPALAGYWGSDKPEHALEFVAALISDHAERVDGIKLSLLDDALEIRLREALPDGVRLYTGDDLNFAPLIAGGSDALLGVFDAIAPAASAALQALDAGDEPAFRELLAPSEPLARKLFASPTYHYKTGLVFLAWLNGHQHHFRMVGGSESARTIVHLADVFRLAAGAGLLADPTMAAERMRRLLAVAGVTP